MSKISEQKALETYSENWYRDCEGDYWDANEKLRKGYIKGYDQAMKDFLEKAEIWLEPTFKNLAGYNSGGDLMNDFKNYIQNEM